MKKNVILASALGAVSGILAVFATKEILELRRHAVKKSAEPQSLPAPQIVVDLPEEQQENENIPRNGIENGEVAEQSSPEPVKDEAPEEKDEELLRDGGAGSDLCYYLPQSKIWHSNDTCAYIVGKEGIVTSTVAKARAAGKKRACDRCGA